MKDLGQLHHSSWVLLLSLALLAFSFTSGSMHLIFWLYRSSSLLLLATVTQHSHIWSMPKDLSFFFNGQNFCYNKDTSVQPPGVSYNLMKPAT